MAEVKIYAMATQLSHIASIENSLPIEGSATLTEETSKGVRKAPTVTTSRVILLTEFGFFTKNPLRPSSTQSQFLPLTTVGGFVSELYTKPVVFLLSPYFNLSISTGPLSRARIGQAATQIGRLFSVHLSIQKSHFCIFASCSDPN